MLEAFDALVRELGPVVAGLLFASRAGSAMSKQVAASTSPRVRRWFMSTMRATTMPAQISCISRGIEATWAHGERWPVAGGRRCEARCADAVPGADRLARPMQTPGLFATHPRTP